MPDVDGPVHAYLRASPGCWQRYGELCARPVLPARPLFLLHVDCYAVQHPGGAAHDRRQRASLAVHLVALCRFADGAGPAVAAGGRGTTSRRALPRLGLPDWPALSPPTHLGATTVADVAAAAEDELPAALERWVDDAWQAWGEHHATVRTWARAAT